MREKNKKQKQNKAEMEGHIYCWLLSILIRFQVINLYKCRRKEDKEKRERMGIHGDYERRIYKNQIMKPKQTAKKTKDTEITKGE